MRFSKDYRTFKDWKKEHSESTAYNRRISNAHKKYPNASLSQLRGHPQNIKATGKKGKVKTVTQLKKKKPSKMQLREKQANKKHKKLRRKVQEKIKTAKQKNFPYYVFGLFAGQEEFDEMYIHDDEEPPEYSDRDLYYGHAFYSKGIKSKEDLLDFLQDEPFLLVYWIYKNNGRQIKLSTLLKHYNMTVKQAVKIQSDYLGVSI